MKILILCTGNSCRSQIAHGFLQSFDKNYEVYSAGTEPAAQVNQTAVKVMHEIGVDLSQHKPKLVDIYLKDEWDYVITVCDNAKETCPVFLGKVKHRLHMGFEDPSKSSGSEEHIMNEFRRVRNLIKKEFWSFYVKNLKINIMKAEDLKLIVKEKYGKIAEQSSKENSCCGSSSCCSGVDYTVFSESYENQKGYNLEADLNLGCGIPTEYAHIKTGDTVIDLGSGAGNDCFVARALTGETGKVIGVDMTEAMINKARANTEKLGFNNVEFRLGDIENMPVSENLADVVISNCVLNLVPDKEKAFSEIFRILKPGGHLSVSDVVLRGALHEKIQQAAEMYAGCVSGAIDINLYLAMMKYSGLVNIKVQKDKMITIPDETLLNYLDQDELHAFKESGSGIFSITVYAEKPD